MGKAGMAIGPGGIHHPTTGGPTQTGAPQNQMGQGIALTWNSLETGITYTTLENGMTGHAQIQGPLFVRESDAHVNNPL